MIDLHNHIIYNIDDGAKDIEESIEMAKAAQATGVDKIIATPHYKTNSFMSDKDEIIHKIETLNQRLQNLNINVEVKGGQEIHIEPYTLDYLEKGQLLSLADSQYYFLIEPPFKGFPNFIETTIDGFIQEGLQPVIAHPERNDYIRSHPEMLDKLVKKGCLLQMNAASVLGDYGPLIEKTAQYMIENKKFHLIGSDAHNCNNRVFCIDQCYERINDEAFQNYIKTNTEKVWEGNKKIDNMQYF
ncbi:tyrosine-protein phosphatase [Staphylococcus debuckii]|uniref:tyrosine-protein phosphatase n=1 Tax=Staphylococcus debuckii TaxID=2044912 RepID=UPI000F434A66|nr:CpsB/CapC family capsule biosynthesis tyrosine phosphatase [Staphylococcus debuckii]AYU55015.1 tyrosine protein phosphatase [Staphylococcus debuckii]